MSPTRLPHPCGHPGCPALVPAGERLCEKHKRENRKVEDANRANYRERGYSTEWDKLKAMKKRESPLCEVCLQEGRLTPAEMVHHKVPLREGGELLDMGNLVSVCRACHARLHQKPR